MLSLRLLAALLVTTSALAPAAAHAERVVTEDAVADAESLSWDADEEVLAPAPEHTTADITSTVVAHGARRLTVQVRYRDLAHAFPQAAYVRVGTPDRRFYVRTSHATPDRGVQITRGQREDVVRCPGLRASLDRPQDRLTVSVPTACLDSPAWVRVGVVSVVAETDAVTDEPSLMYVDDAHVAGSYDDHRVRLGPKVFRG